MCVLKRFIFLLIFSVILPVPLRAEALDKAALCARAQETYGVTPERCLSTAQPSAQKAASGLSDEMSESHIFFPAGGARLDDDAQVQIAVLLEVLHTTVMKNACLRLVGHSDSSGGEAANKALARKRADVVALALALALRDGLEDPSRLQDVISEGEAKPLVGVPSTSPHNRRVEIQARTCRPNDT